MEEPKKKHELSKSVAKKYTAVHTPTYVEYPIKDKKKGRKIGMVKADLRICNVSQADKLYEAGYRGIKPLKSTESK